MLEYFDIEKEIDASPATRVFYVIGARGVGKSYSVKRWVVKQFLTKGEKFIYNKRWTTEITSGELITIFDDTCDDEKIKELAADYIANKGITEYFAFHILPKSGNFYFVVEYADGTIKWLEDVAKITCVSKASRVKGNVLNTAYTSVVFDEFITDEGYYLGRREPEQFAKIVNTVGRANNENLRVFMIGNPDASIELNPYIAGSQMLLDYAHLQVNTPLYYDRVVNGRRLANNLMFIKLTPVGNIEYLNSATMGVWNTSEEEMSATGEVKTGKYININRVNDRKITPLYRVIMETPVGCNETYHKCIYAYYGYYKTQYRYEPCIIVLSHDSKVLNERMNALRERTIYSRIDNLDLREREYLDMYRFNLPRGDKWNALHAIIDGVRVNRYIMTDRNETANIYEQIAQQSE